MFKLIAHAINLVRNSLRDVGVDAKRSGKWPTVEKHFLEAHPTCEACGSKKRLNVHHCKPFHLDPELELDPNNLITLCMDTKECHLHLGHGGSFKQYCPDVRKFAAETLKRPEKYDQVCILAYDNRLVN